MLRGKANPMWKGGIAEYPNHYEMKKNRLIKLRQTKGRCEICKGKANYIHHKDGSKDNHSLKNLITVCARCHFTLHPKQNGFGTRKTTSKFKRLYGFTRQELLNTSGLSPYDLDKFHRKNKLKKYLIAKKVDAHGKSRK